MSKRKDGGGQQAGGIMESKNENVKVPLISKIAYGFGDVGCNFSWMFVSNFLMIFTQTYSESVWQQSPA